MKKLFRPLLILAAFCGFTRAAVACDTCALFLAEGEGHAGFTLANATQFTHFGTLWDGAHRQPNVVGQSLDSTITQLTLAYGNGGPWLVQAALPYLRRTFTRPDDGAIEHGRVSGLGDATLAARLTAWHRETGSSMLALAVFGGVKFATGNADHLGDELAEAEPGASPLPASGIHGHDLALGSGATDFVFGGDATAHIGRWFARTSLQYKLHRAGKFGYRFADEVATEVAAGRYLVLEHTRTLAVQAFLAAEHKGLDVLRGATQDDTGFSFRNAGARVMASFGDAWAADASVEVPIWRRTSALMAVPDYRARASLSWRL